MKHRASPRFWRRYRTLPDVLQQLADRNYQLLLRDPRRPVLHFKRIGRLSGVRVGLHRCRLAVERGGDGLDLESLPRGV
jgi:hypothetical protein